VVESVVEPVLPPTLLVRVLPERVRVLDVLRVAIFAVASVVVPVAVRSRVVIESDMSAVILAVAARNVLATRSVKFPIAAVIEFDTSVAILPRVDTILANVPVPVDTTLPNDPVPVVVVLPLTVLFPFTIWLPLVIPVPLIVLVPVIVDPVVVIVVDPIDPPLVAEIVVELIVPLLSVMRIPPESVSPPPRVTRLTDPDASRPRSSVGVPVPFLITRSVVVVVPEIVWLPPTVELPVIVLLPFVTISPFTVWVPFTVWFPLGLPGIAPRLYCTWEIGAEIYGPLFAMVVWVPVGKDGIVEIDGALL
jgi:hypothetical protein